MTGERGSAELPSAVSDLFMLVVNSVLCILSC